MAKNGASCVSRVAYPYLWILATTDPPMALFGGEVVMGVGGFLDRGLSPCQKIGGFIALFCWPWFGLERGRHFSILRRGKNH